MSNITADIGYFWETHPKGKIRHNFYLKNLTNYVWRLQARQRVGEVTISYHIFTDDSRWYPNYLTTRGRRRVFNEITV